jgi:hypothetical protein
MSLYGDLERIAAAERQAAKLQSGAPMTGPLTPAEAATCLHSGDVADAVACSLLVEHGDPGYPGQLKAGLEQVRALADEEIEGCRERRSAALSQMERYRDEAGALSDEMCRIRESRNACWRAEAALAKAPAPRDTERGVGSNTLAVG